MVTFKRREFLKSTGLVGVISLINPWLKMAIGSDKDTSIDLSALQTYIDLLLPEDRLPGALQLGADKVILKKAKQDERYAKAIYRGVNWLNFVAKKLNTPDFASVSVESQLKIVALSERSQIATLPNLFYLTVRQDVFQYYYAHPEILKYFYYARPPQPLGFVDFTKPPSI